MMINKRLINEVSGSRKFIVGNVVCQWISLLANMTMIFTIAYLLENMYGGNVGKNQIIISAAILILSVIIRFICVRLSSDFSFKSSKSVKKQLREMIYRKLLRLGVSYRESVTTSEIVQLSTEGVEQLETYFGAYLPQFFYAMAAPLTLFAVTAFISLKAALVLLICVPLIPAAIIFVQKIAKRLLSKYWGQYTALGDTFLENLQGLTTLKIYQSDEFKNTQMNEQSENFRKITMKVLTMQLNSITIMDLVAFGGAAVGIIIAATEFAAGNIGFGGCFALIMLSADFFIPMRQLGSFFHVAMNGMAASDKIFRLIDLPEPESKSGKISRDNCDIVFENVTFSYDGKNNILKNITLQIPQNGFTALAGESGCGKSTIAALLMGRNKGYVGSIRIGGRELSEISEKSIMDSITYISHNSYLFKGTVRENLLMGKSSASDTELWNMLDRVRLSGFLRSENGLDTLISEGGGNLSGGQRQRLALARGLLHDTPIYIFDEAASNIDIQSEEAIMSEIEKLSKNKTVILISHRLANIVNADEIYTLKNGRIAEHGMHTELLKNSYIYANLWNTQQALESIGEVSA